MWTINHWEPGTNGVTFLKEENAIKYYSGGAVSDKHFGIRSDDFAPGMFGSFEGTHIATIYYATDGEKIAESAARILAAAPDLLSSTQELLEAFSRYEMDVNDADIQPPYAHKEMIKKAKAAVENATAV